MILSTPRPDLVRKRPLPPAGDRRRRTVGLLGGSFNPAHQGHRFISLVAIKSLGLDEVWWLVAPQNPLKDSRSLLPLNARVESARAIIRHPAIRVTDIERRLGTRFTADTLMALKRRFPCVRFVWLMGADNLMQLPRWNRWERIFAAVPVAVFDRKPHTYAALTGRAAARFARARRAGRRIFTLSGGETPAWAFLFYRRHPASATDIRRKTGLDKLLENRSE
jgi:nicotinate-nucleotide adenylyltransferase